MRPEKRDARKRKIVEAAARLFEQRGYQRTSLDEIAEEAGVGKATLYHYVEGKDELFGEVVRRAYVHYLENVRTALGQESTAVAKLRRYGRVLVDHHNAVRQRFGLERDRENQYPLVLKYVREQREGDLQIITGLVREGMERGEFRRIDPDQAALMVFAVLRGMVGATRRAPERGPQIVEGFMDVLLGGLAQNAGKAGRGR